VNVRILLVMLAISASACKSKSSDSTSSAAEDTSASSAAAGSVGAALAASDQSGSLALAPADSGLQRFWNQFIPRAFASVACPTVLTANGSGCTNNGNAVDLTYSSCSFGTSTATWSGTLRVSLLRGRSHDVPCLPALHDHAAGRAILRPSGLL
jgi:hypothetical protein